MSVVLTMLNEEKEVKTKETKENKVLEATEKARKKTWKQTEEVNKLNELISGFEGELKNNDINKIFNLSDARMCKYIRSYFKKRIENLTKTEKADLKKIMSPLLVKYYFKTQSNNGCCC